MEQYSLSTLQLHIRMHTTVRVNYTKYLWLEGGGRGGGQRRSGTKANKQTKLQLFSYFSRIFKFQKSVDCYMCSLIKGELEYALLETE